MSACPCCGYDASRRHPDEIKKLVNLTPQETAVFDIFARRFGQPISRELAADILYSDDPSGGALYAANAISVFIHHMNKKLRPHGLVIKGKPGKGGQGCRMHWISAGAA